MVSDPLNGRKRQAMSRFIERQNPKGLSRRRIFALQQRTGFARHRWTGSIRTPLGARSTSAAAKSRDTTRGRIFSGDPAVTTMS